MDLMKIKLESSFMRGLVTGIISKLLSDKLGYKIDIQLNEIEIRPVDGKVKVHLDIDAETTNSELTKIVKSIGLG